MVACRACCHRSEPGATPGQAGTVAATDVWTGWRAAADRAANRARRHTRRKTDRAMPCCHLAHFGDGRLCRGLHESDTVALRMRQWRGHAAPREVESGRTDLPACAWRVDGQLCHRSCLG